MGNAYFVLSAGRTGTVFLQHLISSLYPNVVCQHEPFPARYELLLGNMVNHFGLGRQLLKGWVQSTRQKRLTRLAPGHKYVEVNPLLCPIVDALIDLDIPLHVIHLVRHPYSWARSIVAFKASGYRRYIINVLPFTRPFPTPRPLNWKHLSPTAKALWQWRVCNERIAALAPACTKYTLLRYEDLFAIASQSQWEQNWRSLSASLALDPPLSITESDLNRKINTASQCSDAFLSNDDVEAICGPLLPLFGYTIAPPS